MPFALTLALPALLFVPRVHGNPRLVWTLSGAAAALLAWGLALRARAARQGRALEVEFVPVASHYVQAGVQACIMAYWGYYARAVYPQAPLILAQLLFLYAFEALVSWSRGRRWRLGFGPMPIVLSTNLLLWFKDDWFVLQLAMVAAGALGKQFITWRRDGRTVHVFNPSAFGQSLFAVVLIATGTTDALTWGREIATTFEAPHMLVVIFLGGLVVQYLFGVTLMTLSATATLCLVNLVYTASTGVYFFVNISVAAPIFLGLHLLMTDPSTSPRTNVGRVVFGALYALGYSILFRAFDSYGVPLFWDKLLPVPILNLCVPWIDRLARAGIAGRANRRWEGAFEARPSNLLHMGCWVALFLTMLVTGFVDGPHRGNSIPFWKRAVAEGKPHAGHSLVMAAGAQAEGGGSGPAFNELGLICMEGRIVSRKPAVAARYFARACELGNINGCANVATQYLFQHELRSREDVARALDALERECATHPNWGGCYLVGTAYERGRGRAMAKARAMELYERLGLSNPYAAKGLARIALSGSVPQGFATVVQTLESACRADDAESCWYLAYIYRSGKDADHSELEGTARMTRACKLGSADACAALQKTPLPPYSTPVMVVPGWSTAFPLDGAAAAGG